MKAGSNEHPFGNEGIAGLFLTGLTGFSLSGLYSVLTSYWQIVFSPERAAGNSVG